MHITIKKISNGYLVILDNKYNFHEETFFKTKEEVRNFLIDWAIKKYK